MLLTLYLFQKNPEKILPKSFESYVLYQKSLYNHVCVLPEFIECLW